MTVLTLNKEESKFIKTVCKKNPKKGTCDKCLKKGYYNLEECMRE